MSLIEKVRVMFGLGPSKSTNLDALSVQVKNAVQRNEMASEATRKALQEYAATETLRQIARDM